MNRRNKIIAGIALMLSVSQVGVYGEEVNTKNKNLGSEVKESSSSNELKEEDNNLYETTTGAAIVNADINAVSIENADINLSASLTELQSKITEVQKKVQDDEDSGINYAKDRLSDLYLDAVCDNDNLKDLNRLFDEGKNLIDEKCSDKTKISDAIKAIDTCYSKLRKIETYSSFSGVDGDTIKDTNGVKIQAHGGQVQKLNGKWWWYGEDKTKGYRSNGISAYSSDDMYNWDFEGYVMRDLKSRDQIDNDPYYSELYEGYSDDEKDNVYLSINDSTSVIERPKVIYNEKNDEYVMWFHDDGPTKEAPNSNYAAAAAGVAVSKSPNGPFRFINRYRLNVCPEEEKKGEWYEKSAGFARDMNLFVDDDKTAYIVYSSEENRTMFISKLNDDYTYLSNDVDNAVEGEDFVRLFPGAQREAPALFKYNNKYYLITSGATGWDPNAAKYWTADSIFGEWEDKGNPCVGDTGNNTFKSQSTNVIPVNDKSGKFIFMADRWKSSDLGDSRYIWLPLEFESNGNLLIKKYTDWTLSDLENKYSLKINSEFKDIYTNVNELPKTLNVSVYKNDKLVKKNVNVSWDIGDLKILTKTTVKGRLEGLDREVSTSIVSIPNNLEYYIDCGDTSSPVYDIVNANSNLINNDGCDKSYTSGSYGYTGKIGTDINYKNKNTGDPFNTGFWAYGGKSIDYKLSLKKGDHNLILGFYEWWNTSRNMNVTMSYTNSNGEKVEKKLGEFTNRYQSTLEFKFDLPEDADVTFSVNKVKSNNPDPILSWIGVQSLS